MRPSKDENARWSDLPSFATHARENWYGRIALGNASEFTVFLCWLDETMLFVGVEEHGCYSFRKAYQHHGYIGDKLQLCEADARNFADFLNAVFGLNSDQGKYDGRYCDD